MGKHTTFHDCNVFEGPENALPRATVEDTQPSPTGSSPAEDLTISSSTLEAKGTQPSPMGMPLVDPTISTAMCEVEDTQPSPTGTSPVDNPTVPSAIPGPDIREDLSATQSSSPARLGKDSVALTIAWADQLTIPPTPSSSMGNEGKEYLKWIKVHSSHKATAVGSILCNPRESWCCHDCSSRWQKRTHHLLEEK